MTTNKKLRDAVDAAFPVPDSPHGSVHTRAIDNRAAFTRGWTAALATADAEGAGDELPKPIGYAQKQPLLEYAELAILYAAKPAAENGHEPVALYSEDQVRAILAARPAPVGAVQAPSSPRLKELAKRIAELEAAAPAAPIGEAKPVAWRIWRSDRWCFAYSPNRDLERTGAWEPLYTHPAAAMSNADAAQWCRDNGLNVPAEWEQAEHAKPEPVEATMVCAKCGADRLKVACPIGFPCAMTATAYAQPVEQVEQVEQAEESAGGMGSIWNAGYRAGQQAGAVDGEAARQEGYASGLQDAQEQLSGEIANSARWQYIEEHGKTEGGGSGFRISVWIPFDCEDMGCGVDAARAASANQKGE